MKRFAVLVVLSMLGFPAAHADSVHERNVEYFWSLVGAHDPGTPATFADGRTLTLAEAIEAAATRAGSVDLAALSAGAAPAGLPSWSYIWIFEIGNGDCTTVVLLPGSPVFLAVDPQTAIPNGAIGVMTTSDGFGEMIDFTMKTVTSSPGSGFTATGESDFFCFSFGLYHLAFPILFGEAHWN